MRTRESTKQTMETNILPVRIHIAILPIRDPSDKQRSAEIRRPLCEPLGAVGHGDVYPGQAVVEGGEQGHSWVPVLHGFEVTCAGTTVLLLNDVHYLKTSISMSFFIFVLFHYTSQFPH